MSPSNKKSIPNCGSASIIENNTVKRSFSKTLETSILDDNLIRKKKKLEKHSEEEINNAVHTASYGYMTRNRLNKELKGDSDDGHSKDEKPKCKPRGKRIRKKSRSKTKLQLGFVFTNDIGSTYSDKKSDAKPKKCTPLLFESDSESEKDVLLINISEKNETVVKSFNEHEIEDNSQPAFNKNTEIKTYFNKKSTYSLNNKSNTITSNTEEINPSKIKTQAKSSKLLNEINYFKKSKLCEVFDDKLFKCSDDTISNDLIKKNSDDHQNTIIVTESFLKQLEEELSNDGLQGNLLTNFNNSKEKSVGENYTEQYTISENSIDDLDFKLSISKTENHVEPNNLALFALENSNSVNQSDICMLDSSKVVDLTYGEKLILSHDNNFLLEHNTDINKTIKSKPLPLNSINIPENNSLTIFDVSNEKSPIESYTNSNQNNINENVFCFSDLKVSSNIPQGIIEPNNVQNKSNFSLNLSKDDSDKDELVQFKQSPLKITYNAENKLSSIFDLPKNNLSSIFDLPNDKIVVESSDDLKQSIEKNLTPEHIISTNTSKDIHSTCLQNNISMFNHDTDSNKYDSSKQLSFHNTSITENNSTSIFDLPKEETSVDIDSHPGIKNNNMNIHTSFPSDSELSTSSSNNLLTSNYENNLGITENNSSNIFDLPKEETLVDIDSYSCIKNNNMNILLGFSSDSELSTSSSNNLLITNYENNLDQFVNNYQTSDKNKNTAENCCSFINRPKTNNNSITNMNSFPIIENAKKRMSDLPVSELKNDCLVENHNLIYKVYNSSKKIKREELNSKCHCKVLYSFNKNANKILTSKVKHFAFNINAKKNHQKFLDLKRSEASILKSLIINDIKNNIQLKMPLPSYLKPISIYKKYEKNSSHIEPLELNMLKDKSIGKGVDNLSENCGLNKNDSQLLEQEKPKTSIFNVQADEEKQINNIHLIKNNCVTVKNSVADNFTPNKIDKLNYENHSHRTDVSKSPVIGTNINDLPTLTHNKSFVKKTGTIDFAVQNSTIKENNIDYKIDLDHSSETNLINSNTANEIKTEDNYDYNITDIKLVFNPYQSINNSFLVNKNSIFDEAPIVSLTKEEIQPIEPENILLSNEMETNSSLSNMDYLLTDGLKHQSEFTPFYKSESSNKSLFDSTYFETENSCGSSSDDESKLQIEDHDDSSNNVDFKTKPIGSLFDKPNDSLLTDNNLSSDTIIANSCVNAASELGENNKSLSTKKKQLFIVSTAKDHSGVKDNFNHNDLKTKQVGSLIDNLSHDKNITSGPTTDKLSEDNNLLTIKNKQSSVINISKDHAAFKPILPGKKSKIDTISHHNLCQSKEENDSIENCMFMTIDMCNEFYKKKSSTNSNNNQKNNFFPKNINDILTEMYVDETFVSLCQHINDLTDDVPLKTINTLGQSNGKIINTTLGKTVSDVKIKTDKNKTNSNKSVVFNTETKIKSNIVNNKENSKLNEPTNEEINLISPQKPNNNSSQSVFNSETQFKSDIVNNKKNSKLNEPTNEELNLISPQKPNKNPICSVSNQSISPDLDITFKTEIINNSPKKTKKTRSPKKNKNKSNMKVRELLRELIKPDKPMNEILESKEFRNLRFFDEEDIANSINVFLFEQTVQPPIITGLSVYKECYDHLDDVEKTKLLNSTKLSIACPAIMRLTSITLALVKMLRSNSLIDCILNAIRKYVLTKKMNTDHSIDFQLIKHTTYFVDICIRLRLLKTLQMFIFDSMVMISNKYCCVIFISLLLWKNCLPVRINDKHDPVIITVLSNLIARKKFHSEQTFGCDIFQREVINLLSVHFNFLFSLDLPSNFIQHVNKPDFFVSVVMFLKCCHPKDTAEFIVNCLCPIIEHYLNTQQDEAHAVKTIESINFALKPFRRSCNATVATYLSKCKKTIDNLKKEPKEHIYNAMYNNYKTIQNKFVEYFKDDRTRSQPFEESLVTAIMIFGSVDYLASCMALIKWKPNFKPSAIVSKKFEMFKSVIDRDVWDKLYAIEDTNVLTCLVNSSLLKSHEFSTIEQLHALR